MDEQLKHRYSGMPLGLAENRGKRGGVTVAAPDPTILEILARAAVIRMAWSDEERILRRQFAEACSRR